MSQYIPTPWYLKLLITPGKVPEPSKLNLGDICVNAADGRLFLLTTGGAIAEIGSGRQLITQENHGLIAGQAVCYKAGGGWQLALNSDAASLGRAIVYSAPDSNNFSLARCGEIVSGLTNLIPGEWYHCSHVVPGGLEPCLGEEQKIPGAFAANPMGQAVSESQLFCFFVNPYEV